LFSRDDIEISKVSMYNRRIELVLYSPMQAIFRHQHPGMAKLQVPQVAEWAEINKPRVPESLELLDGELAKRKFVAGDKFSVADITGLVAVDFMKPAKLDVSEQYKHVRRWHAELSARPSAAA
jgi:glutathione S-transferase